MLPVSRFTMVLEFVLLSAFCGKSRAELETGTPLPQFSALPQAPFASPLQVWTNATDSKGEVKSSQASVPLKKPDHTRACGPGTEICRANVFISSGKPGADDFFQEICGRACF